MPNENLLFPVLNSIPDSIKKINVTMGLPLSETPLFDLVFLIIKIHKKSFTRDLKKCNYFKDILDLVSHPYIYQFDKHSSNFLISELKDKKKVYVTHKFLSESSEINKSIFGSENSLMNILKNVSSLLFNSSNELGQLDKEYLKSFLDILDRIKKINIEIY